MTTPSSDDQPPAPSHRQRTVAEGFGADAGRYDRARPSYPAELVRRVVAASPGPALLDVGCGTGIAARLFADAGCRVLGVEPDPRMAEVARADGVAVEVARFEDWDPAGRTFDAVTAAQSWHWVDPAAGAAKAATVLRPGGPLVLFWNVFEPPPDLRAAFGEAYAQLLPGHPLSRFWSRPALDAYRAGGARAADAISQTRAFGAPQEWLVRWDRPYTRREWLDLVPTLGGYRQLPAPVAAQLTGRLGAAVDAAGGSFVMGYTTLAVCVLRSA